MAEYQTMRSQGMATSAAEIDAGLRAHMNKVYATMSIGMLITAASAWAISVLATTTDPSQAVAVLGNGKMLSTFGAAIYSPPLMYVIMFAPLALIFLGFGTLVRRGSASAVSLGFFIFATVMGLSLSSIFLVFTGVSIIQTFLVTAIAFAGLSIWGYVTKRDLSGMGTFLIMGVWGLLAAMVLNLFIGSEGLSFAISAIGLVIFAGLTAYDTQNIKSEYVAHAAHGDQEWLEKSAIIGAFTLYWNFIMMFQFLLSFLGNQE